MVLGANEMNPNAWQIGKWLGERWHYMPAFSIFIWGTVQFIWITADFWRALV
jgi:hypothetical protein